MIRRGRKDMRGSDATYCSLSGSLSDLYTAMRGKQLAHQKFLTKFHFHTLIKHNQISGLSYLKHSFRRIKDSTLYRPKV